MARLQKLCVPSFHVLYLGSGISIAKHKGTCGLWVQQLCLGCQLSAGGPEARSSQRYQMSSSPGGCWNLVYFLGKEELSSGQDVIRHPLLIQLHMGASSSFAWCLLASISRLTKWLSEGKGPVVLMAEKRVTFCE